MKIKVALFIVMIFLTSCSLTRNVTYHDILQKNQAAEMRIQDRYLFDLEKHHKELQKKYKKNQKKF